MQSRLYASTAERFAFLADALNGTGGFAPQVLYSAETAGMSKPSQVLGSCYLVPYPRESVLKFAARAALAVYENHLRSACERFVGQISRRQPQREGLENPLAMALMANADLAGNDLDVFWHGFMIEAKARGSMLLLVELPAEEALNLADAVQRRIAPYLKTIEPERVTGFELDERGLFRWVKVSDTLVIDGTAQRIERYWDAFEWKLQQGERVLQQGAHPFGVCPVLGFTESGAFPRVGAFAQVADLSRRIFNARSELDEILRSQTFSLLTYQIGAEERATFNAADVAATIGTHNMLVHTGDQPGFIAPSDGPATVYMQVIEGLQEAIRRVSFALDDAKYAAAESGVALQLRFQAVNGALGSFARRMQDLELRMWQLVGGYLGLQAVPTCRWHTDYTLADLARELDTLTAMQATGFPDPVLIEQRKHIAALAFESHDEQELQTLMNALEEGTQERPAPDNTDNNPSGGT